MRFYKGSWRGQRLPVRDGEPVVQAFEKIWSSNSVQEVAQLCLKNTEFWDQDLTQVEGLSEAMAFALEQIENHGVEKGLKQFEENY